VDKQHAQEIAEGLTPESWNLVDKAAEMSGTGVVDFIQKLNAPWKHQTYAYIKRGVISCYSIAEGKDPQSLCEKEGEIVGGPFDDNANRSSDWLKGFEVGWYAALWESWRGGPYEGDQDIDWRVFYGHRPSGSSYQFACGPWDTEEQAKEACANFANGLPFTYKEHDEQRPYFDEDGDEDGEETITYAGMYYDAGILDTYPIHPSADIPRIPPLSDK
jgi:hypothetical protein